MPSNPPADEAATPLDQASMRKLADELRSSSPCEQADLLQDDLAFWDSMRGFDCLDGEASTFVRVYAHAASVPQTLAEWDGTFGDDRAVARGAHWYVIGAPAVISALRAPTAAPRVADDVGDPVPLTAEQDYVTTCILHVSSEAQRYVQHPETRSGSAEQYEALFPGITAEVHSAVDELGSEQVRRVADKDRWTAALSSIGPRLKKECRAAYRSVGDVVHPLGSNES